jgi:RNA polymerase sigma-70 factor (ECF subfamily)
VLAWLYTIAGRRVADLYRRRRESLSLAAAESLTDERAEPAEQAERAWDLMALHQALDRLAPSDRQVIDLHFFAGLSHPEVAAVLGISPNAATVRLHRALCRLSKAMGVDAHESPR